MEHEIAKAGKDMHIEVNPDKELVAKVRQAIKDNDGFCPCSVIKSEDTRCMCKEFRESKNIGWCHCGLYLRDI
jgi:ferredoxin-thioredoxin reductase catalytic subunit